ncbi:signal peptidase II [Methylovirgula sp. 4M-Z18]|uniref:signal peptidase II n=1 Tax=Methylovirgula sp. 4M-Z18 TaxID=2293567 RepID=UPI000E2F143F|nr:signal peptidase II [Methylovirgula sp. 4M-Z18]RFB76386.1 signal peptidase II [Methylovirgula sp. 4M-Z18]
MRARQFGLIAACLVLAADQISKHMILQGVDIPGTVDIYGPVTPDVRVTSFLDIALHWNHGISYSLFTANSALGRLALLAMAVGACLALGIWLMRVRRPLLATGLGLIIGGALGNAYDRSIYGAVADFLALHIPNTGFLGNYVFNLADAGIVAGVAILLYESFLGEDKAA